jgi:hypothetical protein
VWAARNLNTDLGQRGCDKINLFNHLRKELYVGQKEGDGINPMELTLLRVSCVIDQLMMSRHNDQATEEIFVSDSP